MRKRLVFSKKNPKIQKITNFKAALFLHDDKMEPMCFRGLSPSFYLSSWEMILYNWKDTIRMHEWLNFRVTGQDSMASIAEHKVRCEEKHFPDVQCE